MVLRLLRMESRLFMWLLWLLSSSSSSSSRSSRSRSRISSGRIWRRMGFCHGTISTTTMTTTSQAIRQRLKRWNRRLIHPRNCVESTAGGFDG